MDNESKKVPMIGTLRSLAVEPVERGHVADHLRALHGREIVDARHLVPGHVLVQLAPGLGRVQHHEPAAPGADDHQSFSHTF